MANEQKDVVFDAGVNLAPEEVEKQLKDILALIEKYLGPKSVTPKIREGLRKRIETIPDYAKSFSRKRSTSGIQKELSSIIKARETELKVQKNLNKEQKAYNKEIEKLIDMLKNKKYGSLSEFYDIGKNLKTQNQKGEIKGLNTELGKDAYNTYLEQEDSFLDVSKQLRGVISKKDLAKMKLPLVSTQLRELREELVLTASKGGELSDLTKEFNRLSKAEKSLKKTAGLSAIGKFFNRFKSYGLIRVFRNLFSAIEKGFGESLKSLALFDSGVNDNVSKITSSFSMMASSVVSLLVPILDTVTPMIQQIAFGMAEIANSFSKASAQAKGLSTYTKVNADYMKDFSQETQSSLLSFDKFETLSNSEGGMFEQASVDDKTMSGAEKFGSVFSETLNIVTQIVAKILELIGPLMGVILPVVTSILEVLNPVLDVLSVIIDAVVNILKPIIDSIADALNAVVSILKGDMKGALNYLGSMFKNTFKTIGNVFIGIINLILKGITHTLNKIIDGLNFILSPVKWGLKLIGVEWNGIGHLTAPKVDYFANGGLVKGGSLFVAGEHGNAEVVSQFSSGQTGVTNIAQFKQAMLEALFEWSSNQYGDDSSIAIYLDGAEIARSKRFKAELNRTNMELNLR